MKAKRGVRILPTITRQGSFRMPSVEIQTSTGHAVPARLDLAIGSECAWKAVGVDGKVTGVKWQVSEVSRVVANYEMGRYKATITPAANSGGDSICWYLVKVGTVTIKVKALINGKSYRNAVKIKVVGPQIVSFDSVTDAVKVADVENPDNGRVFKHLTFGGDVVSRKAGIYWTAKVVAPPSRGHFAFTQLMTVNRARTTAQGTVSRVTSNGDYVLDEFIFYGMTEGQEEKDTARCWGREMQKAESDDSPAMGLARYEPQRQITYKKAEADESFKTYLMYRPNNGVWVGVALLEWRWSGEADYDTENDAWLLKKSSWAQRPSGKAVNELPVWKNNRARIM